MYPDAVVAARGWNVPESLLWSEGKNIYGDGINLPVRVDVVTGCGAILLKPKFFNTTALTDYQRVPREAFFVDDIWLSGNLAMAGVPRYIVPVDTVNSEPLLRKMFWDDNGLISNENKGGETNDIMLQWFKDYWNYSNNTKLS
jgi:hypothetical protein